MNKRRCVSCGHDPACGFATAFVGDTAYWYCHGDDHSCYAPTPATCPLCGTPDPCPEHLAAMWDDPAGPDEDDMLELAERRFGMLLVPLRRDPAWDASDGEVDA